MAWWEREGGREGGREKGREDEQPGTSTTKRPCKYTSIGEERKEARKEGGEGEGGR